MAKTLDEVGVKRLIQEIKGANKNLNTPLVIKISNSVDDKAANKQAIADYIEKAKAAGIADVNGMGVTVLINDTDFSSGVGYLYKYDNDDNFIYIFGLSFTDFSDTEFKDEACVFAVSSEGQYFQTPLITVSSKNVITSDMLAKGARKPIILTSYTTEVDEETYQKLLSDDVDVVFKTDAGNLCTFTYKYDNGTSWDFYFSCFSFKDETIGDIYIYAYEVNILKEGIHKCTIRTLFEELPLGGLLDNAGYIDQSTLYSALKEVDLTGTDAERLARLKNFENIWKYLTGATDLKGARFVGKYLTDNGYIQGIFMYSYTVDDEPRYLAIGRDFATSIGKIYSLSLDPSNGSLTITPLFSHLEAITIYTDNTPEHMQANLDNIAAYESNLQALGVDTTKSPMIPIIIDEGQGEEGNSRGYLQKISAQNTYYGIIVTGGTETYSLEIDVDGTFTGYHILDSSYKSLNAKSLEAITIKTSNSTANKAENKAAIQAYVNNLKALGVSTTNGYAVPVRITGNSQEYHGMLNIGTGVLLSGVVTDVNENHHYPFNVSTTDGVITFDESNYFLEKTSNEVTEMLDAIKYSYTSVPFTDTTLSNKAQLEVFLSKVPAATVMHCTYKEIYAGTLHKINGDWYGLLVKNTNSPADNINVKLSADGTIVTSNSAQ